MKLLWGAEYRQWQGIRAEVSKLSAELEGAERMIQTYAGTIRQLMEDLKYNRERADRAVDAALLTKGLPSVMPEPAGVDDLFEESELEVEDIRRELRENPGKVWHI